MKFFSTRRPWALTLCLLGGLMAGASGLRPASATESLTVGSPSGETYSDKPIGITVTGDNLRDVTLRVYRLKGTKPVAESNEPRVQAWTGNLKSATPRSAMTFHVPLPAGWFQAEAFAGNRAGGTAFDDVTFSVSARPPKPGPTLDLQVPDKIAPPGKFTARATGQFLNVARLRVWQLMPGGGQTSIYEQRGVKPPKPKKRKDGTQPYYDPAIKWSVRLPKPGMYLAEAQSGQLRQLKYIRVTDIGLLAKRAPNEMLVYAVRLSTGRPVPGAAIRIDDQGTYEYREDKYVQVRAPGPSRAAVTGTDGVARFYKVPGNGNMLVSASASDGSRVYNQEAGAPEVRGSDRKVYFYTERPLYRPGQTVYFKGIVRQDLARVGRRGPNGALFVPIPKEDVSVVFTDAQNNRFNTLKLKTDAKGAFSGQTQLAPDAPVGRYAVEMTLDKQPFYGRFTVAEYRKPEYEVTLTPRINTPYVIQGDPFEVLVSARYFFGGPVKGATVEISGEAGGSGKLDERGETVIKVSNQPDTYNPQDRVLQFSAKVTDEANRIVEGSTSVLSVYGAIKPGIKFDKYAYSIGESTRVDISTRDAIGRGVSADARVRLYYFHSIQIKDPETLRTRYETRQVEFFNQVLHTNSYGQANVSVPQPRAGYMLGTVEVTDNRGRTLTKDGHFWVISDKEVNWYGYNFPAVELLLDKPTYRPGDTVKALLTSSRTSGSALVTLQSDRIFMHRVVPLKGNVTVIEFTIPNSAAPGAFLQVGFPRGTQWVSDGVYVPAVSPEQRLQIKLTPDKKQYRPGDTAHYGIAVQDGLGKPQEADISLGLVDKAIYALANDETPDPVDFFYGSREDMVSNFWQFPGEVAGGAYQRIEAKVPVRKDFRDTAFWSPFVTTKADGTASLDVPLPDNLTTWRATARGFTDETKAGAATNEILVTKPLLTRLILPRFLVAGDKLRAQVIVQNNTNNTMPLRVSLRGQNIDTAPIGDVTQGALAGTVAPNSSASFWWVIGADEYPASGKSALTATARGGEDIDTTDSQELPLPILPRGVRVADAYSGALTNRNEATFTLHQPAKRVPNAGRLTVSVSPGIAGPVLEALPSLIQFPYGCTEQTLSRFVPALVATQAFRRLKFPEPEEAKQMPKIWEAARGTLYAYQHSDGGWGWWQNDVSDPFMTAYAVYSLTLTQQAGYKVERERIVRGMRSLLNQFGDNKLDANTRAYMMLAYSTARETWKVKDREELNTTDDYLKAVYDVRSKLAPYGLASLAMAELRAGNKTEAAALLDLLEAKAKLEDGPEGRVALWPTAEAATGAWLDAPLETTAVALQALVEGRPNSPLILPAVLRLVRSRQGEAWATTKETATIVHALTRYLESTQEFGATQNLTVEVLVNGKSQREVTLSKADFGKPPVKFEIGPFDGESNITIRRRGSGSVYYSTQLSAYETETLATGANNGIQVERHYQVRNEKGWWRDVTGPIPSGALVRVDLRVKVAKDMHYVLLEDPAPAGFEARPEDDGKGQILEQHADCELDKMVVTDPPPYWESLPVTRRDSHDDRQAFFVTYLEHGQYYLRYILRPEQAGTRTALPAHAEPMYHPSVNGHSTAADLEVK